MKAATKIIRDLRKRNTDLEIRAQYSFKYLSKKLKIEEINDKGMLIDYGVKNTKDKLSMKAHVDYVLIGVKMEQVFPELKLDGWLDFEVYNDNSVKVRTEDYYDLPIDDKVTIGAYFKKFGSKVEFI